MPTYVLHCLSDYDDKGRKLSKVEIKKIMKDYTIKIIDDPNFDFTASKKFKDLDMAFEESNQLKNNPDSKILDIAICTT